MKVKINNKTYTVGELKIEDYLKMEEQGISILDAFQKKQTMLVAMAFTCAVTGLDRDDAAELLNQHVYGGGNIMDIVADFNKAIAESDFFKKMLGVKQNVEKKAEKQETENKEVLERKSE